MQLLFKQRLFSWFDSYDIYDETGNAVYTVKGQLAWGHCLKIFDVYGNELGMVQQKLFTLLPKFEIYMNGNYQTYAPFSGRAAAYFGPLGDSTCAVHPTRLPCCFYTQQQKQTGCRRYKILYRCYARYTAASADVLYLFRTS